MAKSVSRVRVAVIGLGMGAGHAEMYLQTPEAELVAVVDADEGRLGRWKGSAQETAQRFSNHKAMLKAVKPDLASVALPNFLHAPVTIDCLRAGAHVLCEKPMAMNVAEALRMKREAEKRKRKLGINLSFRFTPQARALKDLANDGFLGRAYHAATRWTRRDGFPGFGGWFGQKKMSGGGPLIDLGVHRIDLALWLMGNPEPVSVSGMTHRLIGEPQGKAMKKPFDVEDLAAGFVRLSNGASLVLEVSWAGHQAEAEMISTTVMGTRGTLVHRNIAGGYEFAGEYYTEKAGHKLAGKVAAAREDLRSSYGEMVRAIVNDTEPLAGAEDGVRLQRILDGLYESAQRGREVRV